MRIATSRSRGEMQKGSEGNADLWEEFETVLKRNISRVKGHATKVHTDRQITASLNKGGHDAADASTGSVRLGTRTVLLMSCFLEDV